jgi:hypothetical protein
MTLLGTGAIVAAPPGPPFIVAGFPTEIISHAVWLRHAFGVSLRDVEVILAARGIAKPRDAGARNSARTSPIACGAADPDQGGQVSTTPSP